MQLVEIRTAGFRNLPDRIVIASPLAVVVGENNVGKSNLIDALRAVLRPLASFREQHEIRVDDFTQDAASGDRIVDEVIVELVFEELNQRQQGRMLTCLHADGHATLGLRVTVGANERPVTSWFGGEGRVQDPDLLARGAATFTYLHPLRNAEADLRPGRQNRLVALLRSLAPDAEKQAIVDIAKAANVDLAKVGAITSAKTDIQSRLDMILGSNYGQKIDLLFADPVFERVVGALRAAAGDVAPHDLDRNGLGYNNLLYIATLLAGLEREKEVELHLLLIEEPEAHLHPQLQDLLMRYIDSAASGRVQVVVTTHSPNLASTPSVERVTALARAHRRAPVIARAIKSFDLAPVDVAHLHRFLDVTKASLLFARGVILVEGVAEQLVVPAVAAQLDRRLADYGIAVVNIGGLAFGPFARLFGPNRLPARCALLTDRDPPADDPAEEPQGNAQAGGESEHDVHENEPVEQAEEESEGAQELQSATSAALGDLESATVRVFRSEKTFVWDLVKAGNWDVALDALAVHFPRVAKRLREGQYADDEERATAFLDSLDRRKARVAQELLGLAAKGRVITPPDYIRDAVLWVTEVPESPGEEGEENSIDHSKAT